MQSLQDHARALATFALRIHKRDPRFYGVLVCLGVSLFCIQEAGGARNAEFDGYPDESAQFVSGRMVWEYLRTAPRENPMRWAEQYYLHYPKIGIGHWPPGFHLTEAVWSLAFGSSRNSAMWLQWFLALSSLMGFYTLIRFRLPLPVTLLLLGLAMATPVFQQGLEQTMSELEFLLCTVLFMHAMLRLMERPDRSSIYMVSGSLLAAGIVKGTVAALLPVPILALAATRTRIKLRSLGPLAVVLGLLGAGLGWYFSTQLARWAGINRALPWLISNLWKIEGWGLLAVALLGMRRKDRLMILAASMLASAIAVSFAVRAMNEPRHWIVVLPAILVLAGSALTRFPKPVGVLLLVPVIAFFPWQWYRQSPAGYRDLIVRLHLPARMLISSARGGSGEGGWIAQVSTAERYPASFVVRASKLLASSDWNGEDYHLMVNTPAEVQRRLDELALDIVVIEQPSAGTPPHQILLQEGLAGSDSWKPCASSGQTIAFCRTRPPLFPRKPLEMEVAGRHFKEVIQQAAAR